ncbi:MAG: Gfo/Idh/MocA family oxidoreductase [Bacilli bacterium]|nr:Gfo/Idh/MocA family oxidoreductase [Bacilli bacterium]
MRLSKPDEKITISVIGAGNRAEAYLQALETYYPDKYEIVAIAEPRKAQQLYYQEKYQLREDMIFASYQDFIKMPRLSDLIMITTLDDMHYLPTIYAIKTGYDIILEKPISMTLAEIIEIGKLGKEHQNQLIAVCHVLRHSLFFKKLKEIVDSKVLGKVINIQHNENIGYYHFAHSYVRGNWRNTEIASPLSVAKSCHDFDILLYLLKDKHCLKLSSMGDLAFFNQNNYDEKKMAPFCSQCSIEAECPYSAIKIYGSKKIRSIVFNNDSLSSLKADLDKSNYGRCVFNCDNNVVDHQVTILEFEGGVHATFNLSAFTDKIHRSIKIMCEYGEIRAIETKKEIEITHFGKEEKDIIKTEDLGGGHGGADISFMMNFMDTYLEGKPFDSTLAMSIESHLMAFAAEDSRLAGGELIDMNKFYIKKRKER